MAHIKKFINFIKKKRMENINYIFSIQGRLAHRGTTDERTSQAGNAYKVRNLRIETLEERPQIIPFGMFGDKTKLLDGISLMDIVEIRFTLKQNINKGYYNIRANAISIKVLETMTDTNTDSNEEDPW